MQRPHYEIQITFLFLNIKEWAGQSLQIYNETSMIFSQPFLMGLTILCDTDLNSKNEALFITLKINHNSQNLNLTWNTTISSTDMLSWGIRDLKIYKSSCHETCKSCFGPLYNQCSSCYDNAKLITEQLSQYCSCIGGFYLKKYDHASFYPSSVCKKCDKTCLTCDGGGIFNCRTCPLGFNLSNKQCISSSKIYFNLL